MSIEKTDVVSAIRDVVDNIEREPYIVHSESDIHSMLYCKLYEKNNDLYPINLLNKGKPVKDKNGNPYRTNLIHGEYFYGKDASGKRTRKRFDLVIFDENDVKNITRDWLTHWTKDDYEIINLKHVIEVKFEFGGGGPKNRSFETSLAKDDINKLIEFRRIQKKIRNIEPYLYFIYIVRWATKHKVVRAEIMTFVENLGTYCDDNDVTFQKSINFLI